MRSRRKITRTALALLLLPGSACADQLDGFRGLVAPALVLNGLVSLLVLWVCRLFGRRTWFGKVLNVVAGIAATVWCLAWIDACWEDWPQAADSGTYTAWYASGMTLCLLAAAVGLFQIIAVLRSVFKRTPSDDGEPPTIKPSLP